MGRSVRRLKLVAFCASRLREREFFRFLIVGALNTLLTYVIYVALVLFLTYPIAYTVTCVLGIFISYYLNARFVFKKKLRLAVAFQYPVVYLVQYLVGLVLLYLLVERVHLSKFIAPIFTVFVTVPVTYLTSRYVIVRGSGAPRETTEPSRI